MHLCPQVPTAAKVHALNANSKLASFIIMVALFPPNYNKLLPNLPSTECLTNFPILVEPVNDNNGILLSSHIFLPISAPPWTTVKMFGFSLFFWRIYEIIFDVAIVTNDVVGAPFQVRISPQIRAIAAFQPNTAQGKLNAVITPTMPKGFHTSIIKCYGLSELNTDPPIVLDKPHAISQISITYCTSPLPSDNIFPISKLINCPNGSFLALKASPICLTISPLTGIGTAAHYFLAYSIALIAF